MVSINVLWSTCHPALPHAHPHLASRSATRPSHWHERLFPIVRPQYIEVDRFRLGSQCQIDVFTLPTGSSTLLDTYDVVTGKDGKRAKAEHALLILTRMLGKRVSGPSHIPS